jgi:two-component system, chemotaxis family, response regulator Rcp1
MRLAELMRPVEILLVEDDPAEIYLLEHAFKESQTPVRLSVAQDGEDALAFLRREGRHTEAVRPDLILLTLKLPGKDGQAVLADLRRDPALRAIPVIVLTSSHAPQDIEQCYALAANCYIIKPVDMAAFLNVIRAIEEFWFTVVALPSK